MPAKARSRRAQRAQANAWMIANIQGAGESSPNGTITASAAAAPRQAQPGKMRTRPRSAPHTAVAATTTTWSPTASDPAAPISAAAEPMTTGRRFIASGRREDGQVRRRARAPVAVARLERSAVELHALAGALDRGAGLA